jgi:hypothetical protein
MKRLQAVALAFGISLLAASPAQAARGPLYASFGLGPFIEIADSATLFTIKPEIGWYFASVPGLAIELPLHLAFGDFTFIGIVPGAHYDFWIPGVPGLYLGPSIGAGIGFGKLEDNTEAGFDLRLGATLKYFVVDRFSVNFTPVALNFLIGAFEGGTPVNYDLLFAVQYHF